MLLDFNLAEDTKLRGTVERAAVGGTLPYMSPEQFPRVPRAGGPLPPAVRPVRLGRDPVRAFSPDGTRSRCGAASGRPSFRRISADRLTGPPSARDHNLAVSPAVAAVFFRSASPRPRRPLRVRRRPPRRHRPAPGEPPAPVRRKPVRAGTGGEMGAAAPAARVVGHRGGGRRGAPGGPRGRRRVLVGPEPRRSRPRRVRRPPDRVRRRPARSRRPEPVAAPAGRITRPAPGGPRSVRRPGRRRGDVAVGRAGRRLSEPDRARLRGDIGETFYLMAHVAHLRGADDPGARAESLARAETWNEAAGRYASDRLPRRRGSSGPRSPNCGASAPTRGACADPVPRESARDLYLLGAGLTQQGRPREALPHLRQSTFLDPTNFSAWFVRGTAHLALDHDADAVACFTACLALRDDFAPAWQNRGLARTRLRAFKEGRDDFTRAIALDRARPGSTSSGPRPARLRARWKRRKPIFRARWKRAAIRCGCTCYARPSAPGARTKRAHGPTATRRCASRRLTSWVGSHGALSGSRPIPAARSPTPRRR